MQPFYNALIEELEAEIKGQENTLEQIKFYEEVIKGKYDVELKPEEEQLLKTKAQKKEFISVIVSLFKKIESKLEQIINSKDHIEKQQADLAKRSQLLHTQLAEFLRESLYENHSLNLDKRYQFDNYLNDLASKDIEINDPIYFFTNENQALDEALAELVETETDLEQILLDINSMLKKDEKIISLIRELKILGPNMGDIALFSSQQSSLKNIQKTYENVKLKKITDFNKREKEYTNLYVQLKRLKNKIKSNIRGHYYGSGSRHRDAFDQLDKILGTNYRRRSPGGFNSQRSSPRSSGSWSSSSSRSSGGFSGGRRSGSSSRSGGW